MLAGALVQAGVEDLDDVGMHQSSGSLCLTLKTRDERRILREVLSEQLDSDLALQAIVEGEMNGRHASEAKPALELVATGNLHAHGSGALASPTPTPPVSVGGCASVSVPGVPVPGTDSLPVSSGAWAPPPGGGAVAVLVVVVLVSVGLTVVVLVVVLVVVVLVERLVLLVAVADGNGSAQSSSATPRRLATPSLSLLCSSRSTEEGSRSKSRSVVRIASAVAVQLPSPACATRATVSKSLCSGPASLAGMSPWVELPHEMSSSEQMPSRAASISLLRWLMVTDRTPSALRANGQTGRADRGACTGDVVFGAVVGDAPTVEVQH